MSHPDPQQGRSRDARCPGRPRTPPGRRATDIYTTMVLSSGPPGMLIRQEDYERLEAVLADFGNETAKTLHSQRQERDIPNE